MGADLAHIQLIEPVIDLQMEFMNLLAELQSAGEDYVKGELA